jgi:hypothetical protein
LAFTDVMLLRLDKLTPLRVKVIEFRMYSRDAKPSRSASASVVFADTIPKPEPSSIV